jgi:membrane protein YdbS with pleckstrin-like domain
MNKLIKLLKEMYFTPFSLSCVVAVLILLLYQWLASGTNMWISTAIMVVLAVLIVVPPFRDYLYNPDKPKQQNDTDILNKEKNV